ncbi:MAG: class I SAM-dependent methyltransferase [Sulfuricellaceae bacterium]|jgi:SAM-dependent methyltransferase
MKKQYDEVIEQHYQSVAEEYGLSHLSTMADEITRQRETGAIVEFVGECLKKIQQKGQQDVVIVDVGCGNGFTLQALSEHYPGHKYVGVEKTESLRQLAEARCAENPDIEIISGDIRDENFLGGRVVDILICQRVIINLLDEKDQQTALNNIVQCVASPTAHGRQGFLLFIEAFQTPLKNINMAREEFDLDPMPPAHHNLYLRDDFFSRKDIGPLSSRDSLPPPNFLSTHYFVTRVLHPIHTVGKAVKRNSEFVRFFSEALHPYAGDYSPLKLFMFERI